MDIEELKAIRQMNNEVSWMICDYLNDNPRFITPELMKEVNPDGVLPEETAFMALFTGACGLDIDSGERDRYLEESYFRKSIKKLAPEHYRQNPFYKNIRIPEVSFGNWELKYQKYAPYEAFIRDDIILEPDFKEIPRIGFFSEEFIFPSVMENGHEWMSIKPSELETLEFSLRTIRGKVVTFGLGLGYYTYMASEKKEVESITVIERDPQVIALFEKYIFPQFTHKEKVKIIAADAFQYAAKKMPSEKYDYALVDIWHDTSDGLEPYLKMKKLEYLSPDTIFQYWVEESLLSAYRWQMFDIALSTSPTPNDAIRSLSDNFLRHLAATRIIQSPLK